VFYLCFVFPGLSQQTVGAWHKWLMIMQRANTEHPAEPVAKKPFVPKYPEIPVREDYSEPADEKFWNKFPHNLVSGPD
jgi:hypothetical protein